MKLPLVEIFDHMMLVAADAEIKKLKESKSLIPM